LFDIKANPLRETTQKVPISTMGRLVEKKHRTGLMRTKQAPEASRVILTDQRNVSSDVEVALPAAAASFVINPEAALNVDLRTRMKRSSNAITRHTREKMAHQHIVGIRVSRVDQEKEKKAANNTRP
jgi:type IV secretory pathway VirJ component